MKIVKRGIKLITLFPKEGIILLGDKTYVRSSGIFAVTVLDCLGRELFKEEAERFELTKIMNNHFFLVLFNYSSEDREVSFSWKES